MLLMCPRSLGAIVGCQPVHVLIVCVSPISNNKNGDTKIRIVAKVFYIT